jgi:hypothetical protein
MQTINSAAEFWNARANVNSSDAGVRQHAIAELIRLALAGGAVAHRAEDVLTSEFGVRIAAA